MTMPPNQAAPVNALIAPRFHLEHPWQRVTEQHRWAVTPHFIAPLTLIAMAAAFAYAVSFGPALSFGTRGILPPQHVMAFYDRLPIRFQMRYAEVWAKVDTRVSPYLFDSPGWGRYRRRNEAEIEKAIAMLKAMERRDTCVVNSAQPIAGRAEINSGRGNGGDTS